MIDIDDIQEFIDTEKHDIRNYIAVASIIFVIGISLLVIGILINSAGEVGKIGGSIITVTTSIPITRVFFIRKRITIFEYAKRKISRNPTTEDLVFIEELIRKYIISSVEGNV